MDDQPGRRLGCDIKPGDRIDGYHLGGVFTVARIDLDAHPTSGDETARCAYDAAGRGLVVFCDDTYPVLTLRLFGEAS